MIAWLGRSGLPRRAGGTGRLQAPLSACRYSTRQQYSALKHYYYYYYYYQHHCPYLRYPLASSGSQLDPIYLPGPHHSFFVHSSFPVNSRPSSLDPSFVTEQGSRTIFYSLSYKILPTFTSNDLISTHFNARGFPFTLTLLLLQLIRSPGRQGPISNLRELHKGFSQYPVLPSPDSSVDLLSSKLQTAN